MKEKYKLSIIIPFYNSKAYIYDLYNFICEELRGNNDIAIVFVDDGSTDGVSFPTEKNIYFIKKENGGVSSARNEGVNFSNSEYVAFLDSDDTYLKDYLTKIQKMMAVLDADNSIGLALFSFYKDNEKINFPAEALGKLKSSRVLRYFFDKKIKLHICSCLIRRTIIGENSISFNKNLHYFEDLDYLINVLLSSTNIQISNDSYYLYNDRAGSAVNKPIGIDYLTTMQYLSTTFITQAPHTLQNDIKFYVGNFYLYTLKQIMNNGLSSELRLVDLIKNYSKCPMFLSFEKKFFSLRALGFNTLILISKSIVKLRQALISIKLIK